MRIVLAFGAVTLTLLAALFSFERMVRPQWWLVAGFIAACFVIVLALAAHVPPGNRVAGVSPGQDRRPDNE